MSTTATDDAPAVSAAPAAPAPTNAIVPRASLASLPAELKSRILLLCWDQDEVVADRMKLVSDEDKKARALLSTGNYGKSLSSLALVNKEFNELAQPRLFKVRVEYHRDIDTPIFTTFSRLQTICASDTSSNMFRFATLAKAKQYTTHVKIDRLASEAEVGNLLLHLPLFKKLVCVTLSRSALRRFLGAEQLHLIDSDGLPIESKLKVGALITELQKIKEIVLSSNDLFETPLLSSILRRLPQVELVHLSIPASDQELEDLTEVLSSLRKVYYISLKTRFPGGVPTSWPTTTWACANALLKLKYVMDVLDKSTIH